MSSNWRTFFAIAAVIVLGWFAVMQSTSSGQNPARTVPTRWQYKVAINSSLEESDANRLGIEGWELVTVYRQGEGEVRAVYKRRSS